MSAERNPFSRLLIAIFVLVVIGTPAAMFITKKPTMSVESPENIQYKIDGYKVSEWTTKHGLRCVLAAGTVSCFGESK